MNCLHCGSYHRDIIIHRLERDLDDAKEQIRQLEQVIEDSTKMTAKLLQEKEFSTFKRILPGGTW